MDFAFLVAMYALPAFICGYVSGSLGKNEKLGVKLTGIGAAAIVTALILDADGRVPRFHGEPPPLCSPDPSGGYRDADDFLR